jgi:hypothetical protein
MLTLINPVPRPEPFDHADWLFELKFDGFRAAADTVRGRLISRNGDRLRRFEGVLDLLPKGCVFDGGARRRRAPVVRRSDVRARPADLRGFRFADGVPHLRRGSCGTNAGSRGPAPTQRDASVPPERPHKQKDK